MSVLNWAFISGELVFKSLPAKAFAKAPGYHVFACGALGKLRKIETVPACPNVPEDAVQPSEAQLARIVIVTPLLSVAPQMFAAN